MELSFEENIEVAEMSPTIYVDGKRINIFQKLRFKWFNIYYVDDQPFLLNNDGEKFYYFIDGDPIFRIVFYHRGVRAGKINLSWDENKVRLGDIYITPPEKSDLLVLRNKGLGSKMFSLVREIAAKYGAEEIWGKMQPENQNDPDEWERLRNFYKKQGCIINGMIFRCKVDSIQDG